MAKIIYVTYGYWPPDFGGELLLTIDCLHSMTKRNHEVIALTSGRVGFSQYYLDNKLVVNRSPIIGNKRIARLFRRIIFFFWVAIRLIKINYDVVHIGSVGSPGRIADVLETWLLTAIIHLKKKRCIYHLALAEKGNEPFVFQGLERIFKNIYFRNITYIVSISPTLNASVVNAFPQKARLIIGGIRDDIYQMIDTANKKYGREQMGFTDQDIIYSFVGSVGFRKGFDVLAQAFASQAEEHPSWKLWVIGPRTYLESTNICEREVREVSAPLDLYKERVTWFGKINDQEHLAELLAYSDVFVFPSRREGFGLAPLEAMATGIPVIISRIKGVTDLANIEDETGLYVNPGNIRELEQAMRKLGENKEMRISMGLAGHEIIKAKFGWEPYIDKWEKLYLGDI